MNLICFDAEFAIREILELSIWGLDFGADAGTKPRQVFHQYFRPRRETRWPGSQRVHHISPQMVARKPHFPEWRSRIQKIINEADVIVGFAVDNDIDALEYEGITGLRDKPTVDVRDLHWLVHTRLEGVELDARKGLAVTAGDLGLDFSENLAHGADYDTRLTLACFRHLAAEFADTSDGRKWLETYQTIWNKEREEFLRKFAHGWVALQEWREGYRVKAARLNPPSGADVIKTIEVNARWRAQDEIDAKFDKLRHPRDPKVYCLRPKDLEWFAAYRNEYDGDEPLHRRMAELRAEAARK